MGAQPVAVLTLAISAAGVVGHWSGPILTQTAGTVSAISQTVSLSLSGSQASPCLAPSGSRALSKFSWPGLESAGQLSQLPPRPSLSVSVVQALLQQTSPPHWALSAQACPTHVSPATQFPVPHSIWPSRQPPVVTQTPKASLHSSLAGGQSSS